MSWIDQVPEGIGGAVTADGEVSSRTVEPRVFREAMSRIGTAVHVVATAGPAGKSGFTATAVASVSDAPPTLLVCLNCASRVTPVLKANGVMSVNMLRAGEEAIADTFAGRTGASGEERFKAGEWMRLATGSPVLSSALIAFDCRILEAKEVGTHNVFFAAVEAIRHGEPGPALVYHERAYKRV
jgi:flavin reductase